MTNITVSRTKVHNLTREIRREAKLIDGMIESCHSVAADAAWTLGDFINHESSVFARTRLYDMLSIIEGNAAALREMLNAEDV